MTTNSPMQLLPVPEAADDVDVPGDMMTLAQAVEERLVMRFSDSGDRDSKVPSPQDGMLCCLLDDASFQVYSDSSWRTFYTGTAASGVSYGHISSFLSTPPADARNGAVAVDRASQQTFTKDESGIWRPVGAGAVIAQASYRFGGTGYWTNPGAFSNFCTLTITTSAPNTKLLIIGMGIYSTLGVAKFLTDFGGWQDVTTSINVTPPGGTLTELKRFVIREMNTGGDGTTTVGGPTPRTSYTQHVYNAVTAGSYYFVLRMVVGGTSVNGQVSNIGGEMTIQPVIQTTDF